MGFVEDYPKLVKEWDYLKNSTIDINIITYGSSKMINWKCEEGHEWCVPLKKRTTRGYGCPYCNGKRPIPGVNDFATLFPDLSEQWDDSINQTKPSDYLPQSNALISWRCDRGHQWKAKICEITRGRGCPYCANKRISKGENDLLSTHPNIAEQWNKSKNEGLTPEIVTYGSQKVVWWKCSNGHEWRDSVKNRVRIKKCLYCSGQRVITGENDLATLYPDLQKEWNTNKNERECFEYPPNSNEKVWWKCNMGHEWECPIWLRVRGDNCPYCSGRRPILGTNDLKTKQPELCTEWNYKRNRSKIPENYTVYSNVKIWWICVQGHEWRTSIYHRSDGTGCPICKKAYC